MRLLVLSDSHGDYISLKMAIENTQNVDAVIFLGDGVYDLDKVGIALARKRVVAVKGNCDGSFCDFPALIVEEFEGVKTYCTHGYREKVKFGYQLLKEEALQAGAKIALFGHTHTPYTAYEDGLYIMNPGSVRENSCGVVDITPNGILCFNKKIVT